MSNSDESNADLNMIAKLARLDTDEREHTGDSTGKELKAELDTLLSEIRQPAPVGDFENESGCRRAVELVQAIGRDPAFVSGEADAKAGVKQDLGTVGQYRLLAELGRGGMGKVYKALHTKLEKVVAVKVLPADRMKNADAVARFQRETRAAGKLNHPNIVAAHDAGDEDGMHYLVMELIDGIDLSTLVRRGGPLSIANACELIRQAAEELEHARKRGLIHRDIKPPNLMLADTEHSGPAVKILDFGLALLDDRRMAKDGELTTDGQVMGTIDYMAPEQVASSHNVDIRADIFSLGATLHTLLTGEPVFAGEKYATPLQKVLAQASESVPPIKDRRADVPDALAAVVDRMVAKNPDDRFETPGELVSAIAPFAAGAELESLLRETLGASTVEPHLSTAASTNSYSAAAAVRDTVSRRITEPAPSGAAAEVVAHPTSGPQVRPVPHSKNRRTRRLILAAAICLGLVGAGVLLTVLTLRTPNGELTVEIAEEYQDEITVVVKGGGKEVEINGQSDWKVRLAEGAYQVELRGSSDQFQLSKNMLKINRGKNETVRVTFEPQVARVSPPDAVRSASADPPHPEANSQRRIAAWVQSVGGQMTLAVDGLTIDVKPKDVLPDRPFQIRGIFWYTVHGKCNEAVNDTSIENLRGVERLESLSFVRTAITDRGIERVATFPGMVELIRLDFLQNSGITDAVAETICHFKHLRWLTLDGLNFTDASLAAIEQLRLSHLNLGGTNVTDNGLAKLSGMEIEHLTLHYCSRITGEGFLHLDMRSLRQLILTHAPVGDVAMEHLAKCKGLNGLGISHTRITSDGLKHLVGLNQLEWLVATPTDDGLKVIGQLDSLRHLDLFQATKISGEGIKYLVGLNNLEELDLRTRSVTDASIPHVVQLQSLKHLRVDGDGMQISVEGVARLKQSLPECEIISNFTDEEIAAVIKPLTASRAPHEAPKEP